MCSTNQIHHQYKRGYAVRIRRIISISEDVQYESGTSSVQAGICSRNQVKHQYKRECAVRIGRIFSTSDHMQYKSTTSIHQQYKGDCSFASPISRCILHLKFFWVSGLSHLPFADAQKVHQTDSNPGPHDS